MRYRPTAWVAGLEREWFYQKLQVLWGSGPLGRHRADVQERRLVWRSCLENESSGTSSGRVRQYICLGCGDVVRDPVKDPVSIFTPWMRFLYLTRESWPHCSGFTFRDPPKNAWSFPAHPKPALGSDIFLSQNSIFWVYWAPIHLQGHEVGTSG